MDLIRRLSVELTENEDTTYKNRLVQELVYYARFHFLSEENIMLKYGYPNIDKHRELHLALIDDLTYQRSSHSPDVLLDFLINWFITHTTGEDLNFGRFFSEQWNKTE